MKDKAGKGMGTDVRVRMHTRKERLLERGDCGEKWRMGRNGTWNMCKGLESSLQQQALGMR